MKKSRLLIYIGESAKVGNQMAGESKPNPEELFRATVREEQQKGYLKVFLGMAAGVGKTYAMLEEAQRLHKKGVNVVVAAVNTHGYQDTKRHLEGLKVIPSKIVEHQGAYYEEINLDEILRIRPELVLVDELAYSNAPGSRHIKRWQDVLELIDSGINVFATLNVQHIESLKDVVENIAGIPIQETVPDRIIEGAAFIELVDITPEKLLQRLHEGKIHMGNHALAQGKSLFQEDRLMALREIVLRYAAEKIDHDLYALGSSFHKELGWKPREKLLVAVSHSPHSQKLIRTTCRLASNLGCPWIALHVSDGKLLTDANAKILSQNIALARELGAEVVTTTDPEVAQAIARIARQRGATQIIIGRPPKRWFFDFFPFYTILDELTQECSEIDIHVIRQPLHPIFEPGALPFELAPGDWSPYFKVFLSTIFFALANWLLLPLIGYKIVGFLFLLSILLFSLFFMAGPIFFASLLYAVIWDYFFIPSEGFFNEDHALLFLYFLAALLIGSLTDRAKRNKEMLIKRELYSHTLYEIAKEIASSFSAQPLSAAQKKIGLVLKGKCDIIVKQEKGGLAFDDPPGNILNAKEQVVAQWAFENNREAGWSTATMPFSSSLYLPLRGGREVIGVLSFQPLSDDEMTVEEKNFLYTVGQLLAGYLEHSADREKRQQLAQYNKVEHVYQGILSLLARQLEKPLVKVRKTIDDLKSSIPAQDVEKCSQLIEHVDETLDHFFRALENLSAMASLSSGLVNLHKQRHVISSLVNNCLKMLQKSMQGHNIELKMEEALPPCLYDESLIELLVCNLIVNAVENSPSGTSIKIDACKRGDKVVLSVSDEGRGIPEEMLNTVFEKFYKVPGSSSTGLGLGLSVGQAIAEVHGGSLQAENQPAGGAKFSLFLPLAD